MNRGYRGACPPRVCNWGSRRTTSRVGYVSRGGRHVSQRARATTVIMNFGVVDCRWLEDARGWKVARVVCATAAPLETGRHGRRSREFKARWERADMPVTRTRKGPLTSGRRGMWTNCDNRGGAAAESVEGWWCPRLGSNNVVRKQHARCALDRLEVMASGKVLSTNASNGSSLSSFNKARGAWCTTLLPPAKYSAKYGLVCCGLYS
jgi:hypothetical protein